MDIVHYIIKKLRSPIDDPTRSNRMAISIYGTYAKPVTDRDLVYFKVYKDNIILDSSKGSLLCGNRDEYWTQLHATYKKLQNLRISNDAFDLRFNPMVIKLDKSNKHQQIQEELEKIASPYDTSKNSEYLGLFFDGTGGWSGQSNSNVYKFCNHYKGNKFYYGGVGNSIENDYNVPKAMIADGFDVNAKRALFDLEQYLQKNSKQNPKPKIQLIGFSRGAAQANEIAQDIKKKFDLEIDLLLMMDPVYSLGVPGQGSARVHTSEISKAHNFVEANIADNVKRVVVLYATHETRVWFPATKFKFNKNKTQFIAGLSPGNHCDIGGYREREGDFQHISYLWMLEKSASNDKNDPFSGGTAPEQWTSHIKDQLNKITKNPKSHWNWSEIDWYYRFLYNINIIKTLGDVIKWILNKNIPGQLNDYFGDKTIEKLLGDQQDVLELVRDFSTFESEHGLEKLQEWLEEKDAMPITYDYISKPSDSITA
jgi:hypothetical protein